MVEKLDFTMLSPSPRPQPMSVLFPEDDIEEDIQELSEDDDAHSQFSTLSMSTAQSLKDVSLSLAVPPNRIQLPSPPSKELIRSQRERLPLLHYARSEGGSAGSTPVVVKTLPQVATWVIQCPPKISKFQNGAIGSDDKNDTRRNEANEPTGHFGVYSFTANMSHGHILWVSEVINNSVYPLEFEFCQGQRTLPLLLIVVSKSPKLFSLLQ